MNNCSIKSENSTEIIQLTVRSAFNRVPNNIAKLEERVIRLINSIKEYFPDFTDSIDNVANIINNVFSEEKISTIANSDKNFFNIDTIKKILEGYKNEINAPAEHKLETIDNLELSDEVERLNKLEKNQLFEYYGYEAIHVLELMMRKAKECIFNAAIRCTNQEIFGTNLDGSANRIYYGEVNTSRGNALNKNLMLYKNYLYNQLKNYLIKVSGFNTTILKFIPEQLNSLNKLFSKDDIKLLTKFLKNEFPLFEYTTNGKKETSYRVTNNFEKILPILQVYFQQYKEDHSLLARIYDHKGDIDHQISNQDTVNAYNNFVILSTFDNVIIPSVLSGQILINPRYKATKSSELNHYELVDSSTSKVLYFRDKDAIIEEETNSYITTAIEILHKYEYGAENPIQDEYLKFTDFTHSVAYLKHVLLNSSLGLVKISDLYKDGIINELRESGTISDNLYSLIARFTLRDLVNYIRSNPRNSIHILYNILCNKTFYEKYHDSIKKAFPTKETLNNIYSIYKGIFNTKDGSQSYFDTGRSKDGFYNYFTQIADSIFPVNLFQVYKDKTGAWFVRQFDDSIVLNKVLLIENNIEYINMRKGKSLLDFENNFHINDIEYTLDEFDKFKSIKFKIPGTDIEILLDSSRGLRNLKLVNTNLSLENLLSGVGQDDPIIQFIDNVLGTKLSKDVKLWNRVENGYYISKLGLLLPLLRIATLVVNISYVTYKESKAVSKQDFDELKNKYYPDTTIKYNSTTRLLTKILPSDYPILKELATLELDLEGRLTSTLVKDSLLNGQLKQTFSKLDGSFWHQFMDILGKLTDPSKTSEEIANEDISINQGAAVNSFIFLKDVLKGIGLVKELYSYSGEHKNAEQFNANEFILASVLDYLSSIHSGNEDELSKNSLWGGTLGLFPSVNSDKPNMEKLLVNMFKECEGFKDSLGKNKYLKDLNSSELLELISQYLGNTYLSVYKNIINDLNKLNDYLFITDPSTGLKTPLNINLGKQYLLNFRDINALGLNAEEIIRLALIEYNSDPLHLDRINHPLKLIDNVHVSYKKGKALSNLSFIANLVRWGNLDQVIKVSDFIGNSLDFISAIENAFNGTHLVNKEEFHTRKNREMLLDILDSDFKLNLNVEHQIEHAELLLNPEFNNWVDVNTNLLIIATLTLRNKQNQSTTINIKSKADLVQIMDIAHPGYILNIIPRTELTRIMEERFPGATLETIDKAQLVRIVESLYPEYKLNTISNVINAIKNGIFDNKVDRITLNPIFDKINLLDYLVTQEWLNATVGSMFSHPAKVKTEYDPNYDVLEEEASRFLAQHKRNVQHTAAMQEFQLNTLNGISEDYKIAVIRDLTTRCINGQGNVNDEVIGFDGATFVDPFTVYLENFSLGAHSAGITKKLFVHGYDKQTATGIIIKTAGFGLTNSWLLNSPMLLNLMRKMTDLTWRNRKGEFLTLNCFKKFGTRSLISLKYPNYFRSNRNLNTDNQDLNTHPHYYKVLKFDYLGDNKYNRWLIEVDSSGNTLAENGQEFINNDIFYDGSDGPLLINSNYKLWLAFGGMHSQEIINGKLGNSENSIKNVVEIINSINIPKDENLQNITEFDQFTYYLPLKHGLINYLVTEGAIKHGAGNINSADFYYNNKPLQYFSMKMYQAGILLDKEHHADDARLSLMTLVISACASKGYSFEQSMSLYNSLKVLSEIGITLLDDPISKLVRSAINGSSLNSDEKIILEDLFNKEFNKIIINTLSLKDITLSNFATRMAYLIKLKSKIDKSYLNKLYLPLSDNAFYNLIVSALDVFLTKSSIKQKAFGTLAVMSPSYGTYKLYGGMKMSEIEHNSLGLSSEEFLKLKLEETPYVFNTDIKLNQDTDLLKMGKTYTIEYIGNNVDPENVFINSVEDFNDLFRGITDSEEYHGHHIKSVRENIIVGSELGTYCAYFDGIEEYQHNKPASKKRFSLWNLDSVLNLHTLTKFKDFINKLNAFEIDAMLNYLKVSTEEFDKAGLPMDSNIKEDAYNQLRKFILKFRDLENYYQLSYNNFLTVENLTDFVNFVEPLLKDEYQRDLMKLTLDLYEDKLALFVEFKDKLFHQIQTLPIDANLPISAIIQHLFAGAYLSLGREGKTNGNNDLLCPLSLYESIDTLNYYGIEKDRLSQLSFVQSPKSFKSKEDFYQYIKNFCNDVERVLEKQNHVKINGKLYSVLRDSIKIDAYEVIMPKTAATAFGLRKFDSVNEITKDKDFFVKRLKENFASNIIDRSKFSYELKTLNGKHYYILDRSVKKINKIPNLSVLHGIYIDEEIDGTLARYDRPGGKLLYHMQNEGTELDNGKTIKNRDEIYTYTENDELYEIIVTDNPTFYLDELNYNYINIGDAWEKDDYVSPLKYLGQSNNNFAKDYYQSLFNLIDTTHYNVFELNNLFNSLSEDNPNYNKIIELGRKMWTSFNKYLDIVAARIPAQSLQSFMPMKIVAFEDEDVNNAYVSSMQIWLLGSDYDIDTVNLVTYLINNNGLLDIWSPYARLNSLEELNDSMKLNFPTGESLKNSTIELDAKDFISKFEKYISLFDYGHKFIKLKDVPDLKLLREFLLEKSFKTELSGESGEQIKKEFIKYGILNIDDINITDTINKIEQNMENIVDTHNLYLQKLQKSRNLNKLSRISANNLQYSSYLIGADPVNLLQSLSSIDDITGPAEKKAAEQTSDILRKRTPGNFVNKFYSVEDNQIGKACIGINAVGLKSFFNLTQYYNFILNNGNYEQLRRLLYNHNSLIGSKKLSKLLPNVRVKNINSIETKPITDPEYVKSLDLFKELACLNLRVDNALTHSTLITLSTDNAKKLSLTGLNINLKTNGMIISGLFAGLEFNDVVNLFTSTAGKTVINLTKSDMFNNRRDISSTNMDLIFSYIEYLKVPNIFKGRFKELLESQLIDECKAHPELEDKFYDDGKIDLNKALGLYYMPFAMKFIDNAKQVLLSEHKKSVRNDNSKLDSFIYTLRKIDDFKLLVYYHNLIMHDLMQGGSYEKYKLIKKLYDLSKETYDIGRICGLNLGLPGQTSGLNTMLNLFDKYNIDIEKFVYSPAYREQKIIEFENNKVFFNIPEMIKSLPQVFAYVKDLAIAKKGMEKSAKFRAIRNEYLKVQLFFWPDAKDTMADIYKRRSLDALERFIPNYIRDQWLQNKFLIIPKENVIFTFDGNQYICTELTPIQLGTKWGNATFKKFMEDKVLPELISTTFSNKLLSNLKLLTFNLTVLHNNLIVYGLSENMSPRSDTEKAILRMYLISLNDLKTREYLFKIDKTDPESIKTGLYKFAVSDLLLLYTMVSLNFKLGEGTLTNLFSNYDSPLLTDWQNFETLFDKEGNISIGNTVSFEELYPYILKRSSAFSTKEPYIITENSETGRNELMLYDVSQEYYDDTYDPNALSIEEIENVGDKYGKPYKPIDELTLLELGFIKVDDNYYLEGMLPVLLTYMIDSEKESIYKNNKLSKKISYLIILNPKDNKVKELYKIETDFTEANPIINKIRVSKSSVFDLNPKFMATIDNNHKVILLKYLNTKEILDIIENENERKNFCGI